MSNHSTYTLLRDLINGMEIGSELSRFRMQSAFRKEFKQDKNILSIDSYKSYFVKLGYLTQTKVKGFYTVTMHIPADMKATTMREMYNEATGFTEKQMVKFKEAVSNTEYLAIKYKPIEFATLNDLSFIQGTILMYIVNHVENRDKIHIEKIIHYATIADFLNHKQRGINHGSSNVDRFCEANDFEPIHITIFKKVLQCNWEQVLTECKNITDLAK